MIKKRLIAQPVNTTETKLTQISFANIIQSLGGQAYQVGGYV